MTFESRSRGDIGRKEVDVVPPEAVAAVIGAAYDLNFMALPSDMGASSMCGPSVTDFPTATITLYFETIAKEVADYLGCEGTPAGLRDLEERIDRAAQSSRRVRPQSSF